MFTRAISGMSRLNLRVGAFLLCSTLSAGCWCDAGYYICGADGYSGAANCCAPCPAGQFIGASCGLTANWGCNNCPAGSFSAATASASCSPCALDTISGTGATTCTPCAAGTYTFGSGATECNACPPGTFSFNGALPCSPCPPGTYSKASGARNCVLCPAGTFGDHAGLSTENCSGTCATCTAGSTSVPAAPVTCSAGSVPSGAVCAFCPPGTFAPANAPQCLLCPAGTFGSSAGLKTSACSGICASCAAGSTSASATPLICSASDARAVPASLGLQILPAANPSNAQNVDLLIAPLELCQRISSASACYAAASVVGADGIRRFVVGTAAAFNVEPAASMTCSAR